MISLSQSIRYLSLFHQVNTKISTCHKQNSLTLQSNKHDISIRQTSVNLIPSTLQHWNLKFTCLGVIRLMKNLGKPIIKITLLASTQQKNTENGRKKSFLPSYVNTTPNPKPHKMTCLGWIRLAENLRKTPSTIADGSDPIHLDAIKNERNKRLPPSFSTTPKPNPTLKRQFDMHKVNPPCGKIHENPSHQQIGINKSKNSEDGSNKRFLPRFFNAISKPKPQIGMLRVNPPRRKSAQTPLY